MLQWFEHVGYSAEIAGLEREFGRALTKLPDWARRHRRPDGRRNVRSSDGVPRRRTVQLFRATRWRLSHTTNQSQGGILK